MRNGEHIAQCAVIKWCRLAGCEHPALRRIFANPNGETREKRAVRGRDGKTRWICPSGQRLSAEGVRRGIPDLFLPVPASGYHGMFIEMKALPNKPTPEQLVEIYELRREGYFVAVCFSSAEAIAEIKFYLGIESKEPQEGKLFPTELQAEFPTT